jgi:8-oxo-dGTP diphosphatase
MEPGTAIRIAVAVVEHEDRFLIGQRPAGVVLGGLWEFPGGKICKGETPAECAARECLEETGVSVEILGLHSERIHPYDYGPVHLYFFTSRAVDAHQAPRPPFRWVARQELTRYKFPPANAELLASLLRNAAEALGDTDPPQRVSGFDPP